MWNPSADRRHVVFAMRLKIDVAHHYHLVVAGDLLEGAPQMLGGVLVVARRTTVDRRSTAPGRRLEQPCPSRLGSSPAQRMRISTARSASARVGRSLGAVRPAVAGATAGY